jgi:hypothetical protein
MSKADNNLYPVSGGVPHKAGVHMKVTEEMDTEVEVGHTPAGTPPLVTLGQEEVWTDKDDEDLYDSNDERELNIGAAATDLQMTGCDVTRCEYAISQEKNGVTFFKISTFKISPTSFQQDANLANIARNAPKAFTRNGMMISLLKKSSDRT